jgi:hypothetical protein
MSPELEPLINKVSRALEASEHALEQSRIVLHNAEKLLRQHVDGHQLDQRLKIRSADALRRRDS